MDNFEKAFCTYSISGVSKDIKPLLKKFYFAVLETPFNLKDVKSSLEKLFIFLSSEEGEKEENYKTVDFFISDYEKIWKPDLSSLPESYRSLFDEIETLHGAVKDPRFHASARMLLGLINNL